MELTASTKTDNEDDKSTETDVLVLHPITSATVTEYEFAGRLLMDEVVVPLLHKKEYGNVPPVVVTKAFPLFKPHVVFVADAIATGGNVVVNVLLAVAVHEFASMIVTLYVPVDTFDSDAVVDVLDQE